MGAYDELLHRYHEALVDYLCLGNVVLDEPLARYVVNTGAPRIYDANFVGAVRAESGPEIDQVLSRMEQVLAHCTHRQVVVDPLTPDSFKARLLLEGFVPDVDLGLLLAGEMRTLSTGTDADARDIALREISDEDDWRSFARLLRANHDEDASKGHHPPFDQAVTDQMIAVARGRARHAVYYLASIDGADCGFFHAWPGTNGIGKVEDLFTLPEFRHRGVATTLIRQCVDTARAGGASGVIIGARPHDTPKHMYAALGFAPFTPTVVYLRTDA